MRRLYSLMPLIFLFVCACATRNGIIPPGTYKNDLRPPPAFKSSFYNIFIVKKITVGTDTLTYDLTRTFKESNSEVRVECKYSVAPDGRVVFLPLGAEMYGVDEYSIWRFESNTIVQADINYGREFYYKINPATDLNSQK